MATIKTIQTNFTSGVVDPKAAVREDVVFFYNGLEDGINLIVGPLGGLRRRPSLKHVQRLAPPLSAISLSGVTSSAPQGGTHANAIDGDAATVMTTANNLGTTNPFVVLHIDFGAATAVMAVDVIDYQLSAGVLTGELRLQYSTDDAAWTSFGDPLDADATKRSRRQRAVAAVSARYWRLARIGATELASTVTLAEIKFWAAAAGLSNGKLTPFANMTEDAYMTVASDRNLDILNGMQRTASCALQHVSAQLPVLNYAQSLDTLLLFHKDVRPPRIFRQGADDQFDFRAAPFENIPQYDYGAGTGGTDEVQRINTDGSVASSSTFTLLLEGERTGSISGASDQAVVAASIQTALRALPNTSASGITVTSVTNGFDVTFGGDDGKYPWPLISISSLAGSDVMDVSRVTKGAYPGEDIMSDARGWPRCGCFYQSRLHMGGIRSLPNALLSSVVEEEYNLDILKDDATAALLTRARADQIAAIYQIVGGRHLSVFANDGEFYVPQEPISAESVLKKTTAAGIKEGLRVHEVDGALIFGQGVRDDEDDREICTSLREFLFVDTEQSYGAGNLSKLAGHLIRNPVSITLRKAVSTDEADILALVNEDGSLTAYTTLRNDNVNGFVPQRTRNGDRVLDAAVDKKRRVYFVVERMIGGTAQRFVEMWDDTLLLDGGGRVTIAAETHIATEGQSVFAWTFDNPAEAEAIGLRLNGGRLGSSDFVTDLDAKTVTLSAALAEAVQAGDVLRIARMQKTVEGVDYLEGETIQTFVDGTQNVDVTVADGAFTLPEYADHEIQWGFDYEVYGKMMPYRVPESQTLAGEKVRVCRAVLSLFQTGDIEIRANGGPWRKVALLQLDSNVLDRSTMELLYTGEKVESGLMGFAVGGYLEFRQASVAPLNLLAITREVAV
ncbi:MAG: hypothetical protein Q8K65_11835 [Alphaproteobacteria bacterium]|nr:hypothetical protein [Alphaproteobacteria bacterium]